MGQTLYDIPQVAKMIGIGAQHIYRLTRSGELGSYKIGRRVKISQEQLEQWLASKRQYTKYERNAEVEKYAMTH